MTNVYKFDNEEIDILERALITFKCVIEEEIENDLLTDDIVKDKQRFMEVSMNLIYKLRKED